MNIVFLAPRYHPNQQGVFHALMRNGMQPSMMVLRSNDRESTAIIRPQLIPSVRWIDMLIRRLQPPGPGSLWIAPNPLSLMAALRTIRPSLVIVREPFAIGGLVQIAVCLLLGLRMAVYAQSPQRAERHSIQIRLMHLLLHRLLGLHWFTPVKGDPAFPPLPGVHWVPFVAETGFASTVRTPGPTRILCIGKLVPRKNHLLLLESLARLGRDDWTLTIAGACSKPRMQKHRTEIEERIAALGLAGRINLLVNLSHKQALELYAKHDLFVLPSTQEPASVSNLEAMAAGLPVVVSDGNGSACCTRHGIDGWIFADNDPVALTTALAEALRDTEHLLAMGRAARHAASTRFGPDAFLRRFSAFLRAARIHPQSRR